MGGVSVQASVPCLAWDPSHSAFPTGTALFRLEAALPSILEFNSYMTAVGQVGESSLSRWGHWVSERVTNLPNTAVKNDRTWFILGVSNAFDIHSIIWKWLVAFVSEEVSYLVYDRSTKWGDNCKQRGAWWSSSSWENGFILRACSHSAAGSVDLGTWGWAAATVSNWLPPPPPPRTLMGCMSRFSFSANSRPGSPCHFGEEAALNSLWSLGGHLRGDHSNALIDEQFHSWGELMPFSQKGPSWLPDWLQSPGDRLIYTALACFQGWRRTPTDSR